MSITEAFMSDPLARETVRASYLLGSTTSDYTTGETNTNGVISWLRRTTTLSQSLRLGQTADFKASTDLDAKIFGGYDPLGTAWELIPLSFVVDWFLNIGSALQALQALLLIAERVGWTTVTTSFTVKTVPEWKVQTSYYRDLYRYDGTLFADWPYEETIRLKQRIPVESFLPVISTRCNLDFPKVLDSIALLRKAAGVRSNP
jgi:hypothetical protein